MNNKEQFLDAVRTLIVAQSPFEYLLASKVGNLIHRILGKGIWFRYGYSSLKEVLSDLEQSGIVRTGCTENKVFAIWPGPNINRTPIPASEPITQYRDRGARLRWEVWQAFISEKEPGRHCIHLGNGEVRMNLARLPSPEEEWKEIVPIKRSEQIGWAREFIDETILREDPRTIVTLESDTWYVDFPNALRSRKPKYASQWNRIRSQKVVEHVHKWCLDNDVPDRWLFESAPEEVGQGVQARDLNEMQKRSLILNTLGKMSTEDLLQLRVPLRYVLDPMDSEISPSSDAPH